MGKLDNGLRKTKGGFFNAIAKAFSNSQIEDDFYEDLLDNLVMADVGYETAQYLTDELESRVKKQKVKTVIYGTERPWGFTPNPENFLKKI